MADIESNIRVGFDTSNALASIKNLQREISAFHSSIAKGSAAAATATANLQKDLLNTINSTGQFAASMTRVRSSAESFTNALEKNKLSMGEYFRFAGGASKNFSRAFSREFDIVNKVARERVKDLQTQYISLGRDANGALQAIKIRPMILDLQDAGTQMQIAAQRQQIFNQLLKQGSTNLLNFGKNTQWAGRQLMVGFTIPLSIFGNMAAKTFMDLEKQIIRFRRVYGDAFTTSVETDAAVKGVQELAKEFTKYGVAVEKTLELAADAAQMGLKGAELSAQISNATRLAILGEVAQQEALQATISVTDAFGVSAAELADKINFLNAVENESVTAISDLTIAIPKAGPVVRQLGGSVEDLAFFLTAMKEGGINASEGANALKSGLASLINPTEKASEFLRGFGVNIQEIVNANKGDVKGIVIEFAKALDQLDPTSRARAIEQLFGKFQFSRLSTLFQNVIAEGNQAQRVLELAGASSTELGAIAERELGNIASSSTFKFQKAVEDLRLAIAPIGEQFLKAVTPIIEFGTNMLTEFNKLNDGVKNFVVVGGAILAGLGPIFLMTFGLIANGVANIIKGFTTVRGWFLKTKDSSTMLGEQLDYMSQEQLQAAAIASSLEQAHATLEQRFTSEAFAVENLVRAYEKAIKAQAAFSGLPRINRGTSQQPTGYNSGVVSVPGPRGKGDIVPAMLTPGEAVIPAEMAKKYAPLIQGMIAGNIPGFNRGVFLGMPRSGKSTQKNREAADQIYEMFLQSSYRDVAPTEYGHQLAQTSGHSFPIFGLGGVYMGPGGKKVFVKPVMDEKAALAEMRGTEIARRAHGLEAPKQRIVVIRDPQDVKRQRKFLALESELDAKFVNNQPTAVFNEEQYFKQLVASLVRADKDLAAGNLFGDVVADVGPAGVFSRASGVRDYTADLPSMEQQAMVNLLGVKGGAKRAFAESTVGLMAKMTAEQYHQRMIAEIQRVLPMLRETVASFGLTNPAEVDAYNAMIKRLEAGLGVDWRKFHAVHSAVKVSKPKQSTVAGYADGVVSVPGPKGKGDIVPAMLSPGEAVIPADKAKKYSSLINAMISGKIPGFARGLGAPEGSQAKNMPRAIASHFDITAPGELADTFRKASKYLDTEAIELFRVIKSATGKGYEVTREITTIADAVKNEADKTMFSGGQFYAGTAAVGPSDRNEMFNRIGVAGEPFRMDSLIAAADRAEKELNSGSDASVKWASQLQGLVEEGKLAKQQLAESNDQTQLQINYMRDNAKQAIAEGLLADKRIRVDGKKLTLETANMIAEERLMAVDAALLESKKRGIANDKLLEEAQGRLIATMQTASTRQFTITSEGGYGPKAARDATRNMIRTSGPFAVKRPDFAMPYRGASAPEIAEKSFASFREQGFSVAESMIKSFAAGARRALRIASPSKEMGEIGKNAGKSYADGAKSQQPKAAQAGEQIGQTVAMAAATAGTSQAQIFKVPGSRRATTDPAKYAAAAGPRIFGPQNDATKFLAAKLMGLDETVERTQSGFERMNSNLMNVSFAFSSISSITSIFGGELSEINQALFTVSNSLFALSGVLALVNMLEGVRAKILKVANAQNIGQVFSNFPVILGKLKGGFISLLPKILQFAKFAGPVAAAFGLFQLIGEIQKQQAARISGLGDAAFAAGEKLKTIASLTNIDFRSPDRSAQFAGTTKGAPEVKAGAVAGIRESEDFKAAMEKSVKDGGFKEDLEAIKNATLSQAEFALNNLALQLIAQAPDGTDPKAIKEFVAALAAEAGKSDITLDVNLDLKNKNTFKNIQEEVLSSAEAMQIAYGKTFENLDSASGIVQLNRSILGTQAIIDQLAIENEQALTGLNNLASQYSSFFLAIENGYLNGTISASEYDKQITTIIDRIRSLGTAGAVVTEGMFADFGVAEQVKGISDINSQLIILKALMSGVNFEDVGVDLEAIDRMDNLGASTQDVANGNKELEKLQKASGKAIAQTGRDIKNAKIGQYAQDIKTTTDVLDGQLEVNEDILDLYPSVLQALEDEETALRFVNDEKTRKLLLDAREKDALEGGNKNYQAALSYLKDLAASEEDINNLRDKAGFKGYLKNLREQNNVLSWLTKNGMETSDALDVIGDSTLYAGAAAAMSSGDYKTFTEDMKEILKLRGKLKDDSGGTPDKTPFQEATESLREQIKEIKNTSSAYLKLRSAGFGVAQAFDAAKDPTIATALATTKVGTEKWKQLVQLIRQYNALQNKATLSELIRQNAAATADESRINRIQAGLAKLGLTADQVGTVIEQIGQSPELLKQFADDLKDGKINSKQIADYLRGVKNLDVKVKIAVTKEEVDAEADNAFSMINEAFSAKKALIEIDFEQGTNLSGENDNLINMGAINETIKKSEKFIQERNDKISDNEFLLEGIQEQEDAINKKYDERLEALDAAAEANERIANQQRAQLSVSSALATGDIARAADLIQQQREEEAQKQLELRRAAIEKSREQELANTRASDGRTRAQIEADIKRLKGEIRQEEIKNLKPAQDLLDAANDTLDSVTKSVTVLGQNEAAWKAIEANARAARVEAQEYEKAIFNALKAGKVDTLGKKIDNPEVDELNRQRAVNRKKYQQATDPAEKKRLFDLNVKLGKEILKLGGTPLREGGFVSGPGTATSDSIPAWLSNGEYVINAQTVKMLGSGFFDNLNQNKFASGGMVSGSGRSATVSASNGGRSPLLAKFMDFVLGDSIAGALRGDNKISDIKLSDAGMLALGLVPGGSLAKAVKPLSKGAGSSMSLKSMLNTSFSDNNLIKTVNEKLGILRSTEKLVTRSSNPNLAKELLDPANVKPAQGRAMGPGMYFAPNKDVSERFWGQLGGNMFTPKIGAIDALKIMKSKGYASAQDVSSLGVRIDRGDSVASPSIKKLIESGYIGYRGYAKPDLSDAHEVTNWLVGAKGGLKLKNFNLSDLLNTAGKNFAMGGLVKPQYFNSGGMIKKYAKGGDVVPSMLTPGEFVMSKYAVKTYGADTMKSINNGTYSGDSVYNYEINVNVKTDANVDQIARTVISQIKQIDSQRIRSYRA